MIWVALALSAPFDGALLFWPMLRRLAVRNLARRPVEASLVVVGSLLGTAIIIWQITGDGEATVFEGTALVAAFVILATVAAYD